MSSISYVQVNAGCLPLNFEVTGTGPTRISQLPPSVDKVLDHHPFVDLLMKKYQQSIKKCAMRLGISNVFENPLLSCIQFSQWIVDKGFDKQAKLVMKDWGLEMLPPQIALFRHLTHLDLSGNHLKRLFPELSSLMDLEELDISGNEVELPDLSHLPKLRVVRANNCGLVAVPQWVKGCPSLELFECNNNLINPDSDEGIYY